MITMVLLIKFIYMLKNQMKQNINTFLNNVKKQSENLKDSKAFTEYSNNIHNVYKKAEE